MYGDHLIYFACNQSVSWDIIFPVLKPGKSLATGISCLYYMQVCEYQFPSYVISGKSFEAVFPCYISLTLGRTFVEEVSTRYWVIAPNYTGSEMNMLYAPENQKSPATEYQIFTAYFLLQVVPRRIICDKHEKASFILCPKDGSQHFLHFLREKFFRLSCSL